MEKRCFPESPLGEVPRLSPSIDLQDQHRSRRAARRKPGGIMLKARRDAALKVAESLFAAEDAIDAALARVAELNGSLVTARIEAELSAIVGQEVIEMAAATFAALAKARADIVETHNRLSETKAQIGLRTVGVGELGKPPEVGKRVHLQVVN